MSLCAICNLDFEADARLHSHLRQHKITTEAYYHQYHPRYDLHTHEPITFKNKEFYFHSLFNTRASMLAYFEKNPDDENTYKECLRLRMEAKSLVYAPSTVEARTSIIPSPYLVNKSRFSYSLMCAELGMRVKYNYQAKLGFEETRPLEILVDTREQKPLNLSNVTVSKLDFGDYTSSSHYKSVFVERKSLVDLCGTLSAGFERFQRELGRMTEMEASLVICVECLLQDINQVGKTPDTSKIKATPDFLFTRIRAICQTYPTAQFLFVKNRLEMSRVIERIFRLENDINSVDLQFYYDTKGL